MVLFQQGACLSTQPFSLGPARFKAVFMEFVIRRRVVLFCSYFTVTGQHAEGETPQSSQALQILCAGSSFWTEYNQSFFFFTYTIQWFLGYSQGCAATTTISFRSVLVAPERNPTPRSGPPPLLPHRCSALWVYGFVSSALFI